MNKSEFIEKLKNELKGLPETDIERSVEFYSEIIDDKTEEGLTEEEAVAQLGSTESVVAQILSEIPLTKLVKNKIKSGHRLKVWEIVLLAVGSPIWLSLLIAAIAVILSLYVSLWAVIISLWSVFASFGACALGFTVAGIVFIFDGYAPAGLVMIAAAIILAGLSVFMFYGCQGATKGILWLTRKIAILTKNLFIKKEEA